MNENTKTLLTDAGEVADEIRLELINALPGILNAFLILIVGMLVAYTLKWLSKKLVAWCLKPIPHHYAERPFIKNHLPSLILGLGRALFFITIFFTITLCLRELGLGLVSQWLQSLGAYLPNLIGALLVIYLGWSAMDLIEKYFHKALSKAGVNNSLLPSKLIAWSVFIVSLLVALQQVGLDISLIINLSSIVIGVSFLGIALMFSLGAKDSVADILYCYQLSKVLKLGQMVTIQTLKGRVKAIGPVFVILETETGSLSVPGKLVGVEVLRFSNEEAD